MSIRAVSLVTPVVAAPAVELAEQTWRKKILPVGRVEYDDREINFTPEYLASVVDAFNARAFAGVPFQLADERGEHNADPERTRGQITDLEMGADETGPGLFATIRTGDRGSQLLRENPDLGVSVRIVEGHEYNDGTGAKRFPAALQHVLGTWTPRMESMGGWKAVNCSVESARVVALNGAHAEPVDPAVERRAATFDIDDTDPLYQVDLAWQAWQQGPEDWIEQVLRMECSDSPAAARRLRDLAIRDGAEDVATYFLSSGGRIEFESEPVSAPPPRFDPRHADPVRDLNARVQRGYALPSGRTMSPAPRGLDFSQPEPAVDSWGLTPVMETKQRTAEREAFLARADGELSTHYRARAASFGGATEYRPTGRQQPAGYTWADGSPVLNAQGRPHMDGSPIDVDDTPIYMGDARQAERRKIIAEDRRRQMI